MVSERGDRHAAAISSHACAELYGLESVRDDIQDSDNNYTRFICIAKDPVIYAGANRISLVIACDNKPGALYEILSKLAALGINMTKLESCPVTGRNFEFIFFLELEASVLEPGVLPMLEELERSCQRLPVPGQLRRGVTQWTASATACWAANWATAGPSPSMQALGCPDYRLIELEPDALEAFLPPDGHRRAQRHHPLQAGR